MSKHNLVYDVSFLLHQINSSLCITAAVAATPSRSNSGDGRINIDGVRTLSAALEDNVQSRVSGLNYVLGSTPVDPDSNPNGPKGKKGAGTCRHSWAGGRLLEAMGTGGTHAALLGEVGDLGEERSYDSRNVLTWYEVKRSCL
jgi:hypothetical protein